MGGVGKTTMMEKLKKAVERKQLFDCVVRVVIGKKTDSIGFQQAIVEFIGLTLSETTKVTQEDRLKNKFLEMSEEGKKNILVILDDVWEMIDLKVFGLKSSLPSGFKLLLTSRDELVCIKRTNASIDNLIHANLLIESHRLGYVDMHDLARAIVLNKISKFKQVSIVNYGDDSEWST